MDRPRASDLTVLYVSETYTTHDRRFLAAMGRRLRGVAWLCLGDPGAGLETRPVPIGVRVCGRGEAGPDRNGWNDRIAEAAREVGADLVHAGPVPGAGWAATRSGFPRVVVMAWGSDVLLAAEDPEGARRVRETLERAQGFVADAQCVVDAADALGLPAAAPRAVFPWGVEDFALREPAPVSGLRRRLAWEGAHVCVSTRAWRTSYRIPVLLDAFGILARRDPRLRLALLGDGEESPTIAARARGWVRDGLVRCPGQLRPEEVRDWLEASDLYVSTVPTDGSSISLLEAMAAARPAVVSDRAGNREWVVPGQTGWLVEPGDARALATALEAAFGAGTDLRAMGLRARDVVLRRARWTENVQRLFTLYETVAARAV